MSRPRPPVIPRAIWRRPWSLAPLVLTGCVEQAYQEGIKLFPKAETTSSTTEPLAPTTTDEISTGPVVQTVTGDVDSTSSSSAEPGSSSSVDPVDAPPTIELFDVSPKHLSEAGQAELQLVASEDVVTVRLSLDGEALADLKPADFPFRWEALSAKDNGVARKFEVVVEDVGGLTARATATLEVLLPPSGAEKCVFEDKGASSSVIAALRYTRDAIVAVGSRDTGVGLRLTVWKLDPDTCQPFPAWPKTIANWTAAPALAAVTSFGAAVDVDEAGNIVVAGNFITGGKPQSYVARLSPAGSRLWEKEGQVGDEVAGVATATAQFKNRVFVVGSTRTSDVPVRTDGAVWVYFADGESVFVQPPLILKAPFTPDEDSDPNNLRSEWVRAVVTQPGTGYALAVGERVYKPGPNLLYSRAFTVFVHPLGHLVGAPWTSKAEASPLHDAARSVAVCGGGFMAGGWARDEPPGAEPQPMLFWIGADGSSTQHRPEPQLGSTQTHGVACDREGKIVSAGTRAAGPLDARVFTVLDPFGPRTSYDAGVPGDDGAGTVACDPRGFCGWGGYRTVNAKPYALVRVHHP